MSERISVLIPAYRCAATIVETIESVLAQSRPPDEIIVLLDGEVDNTAEQLKPYADKIRLIRQENAGIARARNRLCQLATHEILVFLDSDDVWHPDCLRSHLENFTTHPDALLSSVGHIVFQQSPGPFTTTLPEPRERRLLGGLEFFAHYNVRNADFCSMSKIAVRRSAIKQLGLEPFGLHFNWAEDSYFCYRISLIGAAVFLPTKLVAYRITPGSLSENRIRSLAMWAGAFAALEPEFRAHSAPMYRVFSRFNASKRREYGKILLGAGRKEEARRELSIAWKACSQPASKAKTTVLFVASYLPGFAVNIIAKVLPPSIWPRLKR